METSEGPRATIKKRHSVPRHRSCTSTIAGDRPPRYEKKRHPVTVGRGTGPRHASRARSCSSGSPDPDPFVIRRSQTTEGGTHLITMEIAADRPPRYGEKTALCPSPCLAQPNDREGQALALRAGREQSRRGRQQSRPGGLSYGEGIEL